MKESGSQTQTINPVNASPLSITRGVNEIEVDEIQKPVQQSTYQTNNYQTQNISVQQQSSNVFIPPFNELCKFYHNIQNTFVADWPKRDAQLIFSYLIDWITLGLLLVLMSFFFLDPPKFLFRLNDPELNYPIVVHQTVSSTAIILIITLGPLSVITIAQIWVRDIRDWHQSILASAQLFATTHLICNLTWFLVGGLRPNFIPICKPSVPIPLINTPIIYYDDDICTCSRTDLIRAKHAFPSGHSASTTALCVYLAIYLSCKLKVFDNRSHFWKFVVSILTFFVIDFWISFSRIRDGEHHFKDVIVGMIIGLITAPLIYRLNYCSLIGPDNHIPTRYLWTGRLRPPYFRKNRPQTLPPIIMQPNTVIDPSLNMNNNILPPNLQQTPVQVV